MEAKSSSKSARTALARAPVTLRIRSPRQISASATRASWRAWLSSKASPTRASSLASQMSVANASLLARIAQLETIANASLLARVAQLESVANASLARIAQLEATVSAQAATIASLLDAMPPPPVLLNATYTVPATARGFNLTAAVLASPATTISITYLSGLWNGLAGYDYTAAGSGTCGATCRVPALPWVALIGRWGSSNSSWFLIGTAWSGSIDASRYLSPAANDGDYSDNNGSIIVRVVLR
eukprot:TRINITY_DN2020_c0_g3_i1.p2 TRINITY_DN2020_c0_g3~~TRINITY_DN2020_c0_g3_i1.p2  ORF type:complete len:244 (+),score=34.51 TRINITY_DN2020_c0_g3_i1:228-959(+)